MESTGVRLVDRQPLERIAKRLDPWCRWANWPLAAVSVILPVTKGSITIWAQLHGETIELAMTKAALWGNPLEPALFVLAVIAFIPGAFRVRVGSLLLAAAFIVVSSLAAGVAFGISALLGGTQESHRAAAGQFFAGTATIIGCYLILLYWKKDGHFKWLKLPFERTFRSN